MVLFFGDARTEVIHSTGTSELLTPPLLMRPNQPRGPAISQSTAPWPQQPALLRVTLHRVESPRWSDWSYPEPQQPSQPPTLDLVLRGPDGPVANAELTLIDDDSGEQIARALSDAAGRVTINVPASGSWTAMVEAAGFLSRALMVVSKAGVVLWAAPGEPLGRNTAMTMLLDKAAEVSGLSLASRGTSRRLDILAQAIEQLPLAMVRSVDAFALLAPGVAPPPETYGRTGPGIGPGIGTAGQFSVNGLRSRDNNFTIDGADNNDEDTGVRRQAYLVPVAQAIESLETFQITTAAPDARFGRATGGQVNIVSRYGASRLHGRAFGFLSDRRWNARDYFSLGGPSAASPLTWRGQAVRLALDGVRAPGLAVGPNGTALVDAPPSGEAPSTRMQSGVALGGPAGRRSFWFATYERTLERKQRDIHFAVATFDERTLARLTPAPLLSTTFPVSLPGNAVLSLVPYPNNPAGPYGANTFTARNPADGTGDVYSAKFDRALGRQWSNNLSVRYNATRETATLPAIGGAIDSTMRSHSTTQNIVASWNFLPLRSLTNNVRFAFGRTATSFDDLPSGRLPATGLFPNERMLLNAPMLLNLSTREDGPLLASALSRPGRDSYLNAIPRAGESERFLGAIGELRIAGYSPIGVDSYRFPQQRNQRTYQISEQAAWTRGGNTLYFGFDVRRLRLLTAQARNTRPLLAFHGLRNALPAVSADPISSIEAAAAVIPAGMMQTIGLDSDNSLRLRRTTVDLYAHDEFRISRRMLLTVGLRIEFNRLPKDLDDKLSTAFTPDRFRAEVEKARPACGTDLVGQRCQQLIVSVDRQLNRDLGTVFGADRIGNDPRVGFAWDLAGNGRTVLRAAAGVYTAQFPAIVVNESRSVFP
ncbi:MAG TPA: hypothetical protein VNT81_02035, partial [Vicinamibacterales bacterium]|nr:hypothetical protein [Vicinamibacterales bacterium]